MTMNTPGANEVLYQRFFRTFLHWDPGPNTPIAYAGADANYVEIGDITNPPGIGGTTAENVHDPFIRGRYRQIGETTTAPDFATAQLTFSHAIGSLIRINANPDCPLTVYEPIGQCGSPSDLAGGWDTAVRILSQGRATGRTRTGNASMGTDNRSTTTADFSWRGGIYDVGKLAFGEKAAASVTTHIQDVTYGTNADCGECGVPNDGTLWIYAIANTDGASPPSAGKLVYSVDGGGTWAVQTITGLDAGQSVDAVRQVGPYLVVLSTGEGGYFYTSINPLTGVPLSTGWQFVDSGFAAGGDPTDMVVVGPSDVWFCGLGGYVYQSTSIPSGVAVRDAADATSTDLRRIHAALGGSIIVAVGDSGTIIKSTNRGRSFGATASTGSLTQRIQAVHVISDKRFWIGTNGEGMLFTIDGGESWTRTGDLSATAVVTDIRFVTVECGYAAVRTSTPTAALYSTFTTGRTWNDASNTAQKRVIAWPTLDEVRRIAVPTVSPLEIAANTVAIGGVADDGGDGVIYLGAVSVRA